MLGLILIAATYWIVSQLNQRISDDQMRLEAIDANHNVNELIKYVQRHRGTSTIYFNGDKSVEGKLKELEEQIGNAAGHVDVMDKNLGNNYEISDKWRQWKQDWSESPLPI